MDAFRTFFTHPNTVTVLTCVVTSIVMMWIAARKFIGHGALLERAASDASGGVRSLAQDHMRLRVPAAFNVAAFGLLIASNGFSTGVTVERTMAQTRAVSACASAAQDALPNFRIIADGTYILRAVLTSDARPETPVCYLVASVWRDTNEVVELPTVYASFDVETCTTMAAAYFGLVDTVFDVSHGDRDLNVSIREGRRTHERCPPGNPTCARERLQRQSL